ncbi:MAG: EamA family transporter [Candidatus Nomurabacteria bacterium]|nr:EamA family transporter [Candidatus Nomurabacteria bacterium]
MQWFLIALITPVSHSIANFVDKILLSKYFSNFSLYVFMIYSAITSIILLPIFLIFGGTGILQVPFYDIAILTIAGICEAGAIYFYLVALNKEDASVVVPFFQLIPVASFILSRIILGETLSTSQMIGSLVIISGAAILSIEIEEGKKIRFRRYVVLSMVAMAVLMAFAGVLFKFVALSNNFWLSNFWETFGFALFGTIVFFIKKRDRNVFFDSIKMHKSEIILSVMLSEIFTLGGNVALNYAFLLAPIALARTVEGYQPIFVLIFGIIITKMFPKVLQEKTHWKHLVPKILAILIIFIGSYLILK